LGGLACSVPSPKNPPNPPPHTLLPSLSQRSYNKNYMYAENTPSKVFLNFPNARAANFDHRRL